MNDYRSTFLSDVVFDTPRFSSQSEWSVHVPFAFWLMSQLKPRRFLELGSHSGVSYFAVCQAVLDQNLKCACSAVGSWADTGGKLLASEQEFRTVEAYNQGMYSAFSKISQLSAEDALTEVENGSVDLLHINGCRLSEDVEKLFNSCMPKLSDRAVVLLHGTTSTENLLGIGTFWEKLQDSYPCFNFDHGRGLGVVAIGKNAAPALHALWSESDDCLSQCDIHRLFASLGNSIIFPYGSENRQQLTDEGERTRQSSEVVGNHNAIEVVKLTHEREELASKLRHASIELAQTRNRPFRLVRHKIAFKVLNSLLKLSPILPERRVRRFRQSALKRDPRQPIRDAGFALHGGKLGKKPKKAMSLSTTSKEFEPDKPTILVIDHDASKAESSAILLNIARELSKKYNIVSITLRNGAISEQFNETSVATVEFDQIALNLQDIARTIGKLQEQFDFKYAIANAFVSRFVLMALRDACIPSTTLIHDFAYKLLPVTTVPEVFSNSDAVVFSSEEVLRDAMSDALSHAGLGRPSNASVIHPSRYYTPSVSLTDEERREEITWLNGVLGQGLQKEDTFVVVGVGDVEMRKGLDLFIDVAKNVVSRKTGVNFRFVWFGTGYDPIREREHSLFLADQILKAGLRGHLRIVRPTAELSYALGKADAMLLSSRLDPFPNAAIDAVLNRTPVLCFDRATGFAQFLKENGNGEACVADYLNTAEMVEKLVALAQSEALQNKVAEAVFAAGREAFDLSKYVEKLDAVASQAIPVKQQIEDDSEFLKARSDFRPDFFWHKDVEAEIDQQLEEYLIASRSGIVARKPMPGFHPSVYAESNGLSNGTDPFVEFLKAGRPEGPWLLPVVDEKSDIDLSAIASCSTALHLHVFYEEGLKEILQRVSANATRPDLFLSTSASKVDAVKEALVGYEGKVAKVEVVSQSRSGHRTVSNRVWQRTG